MNDIFLEWMIKRRMTTKGWLLRIGSILLCIFLFVGLSHYLGIIALFISIAAAYLVRYVFQATDLEIEYAYLSGELDIDKIMGKYRRKRIYSIKMEQIEFIAPEGSPELKAATNSNRIYKHKDFSSCIQGNKKYVIIGQKDEQFVKILFEPNDKIIEAMKAASPRKVII